MNLLLTWLLCILYFGSSGVLFLSTYTKVAWTLSSLILCLPIFLAWFAVGYLFFSMFMTALTAPGSKTIDFSPISWTRSLRRGH